MRFAKRSKENGEGVANEGSVEVREVARADEDQHRQEDCDAHAPRHRPDHFSSHRDRRDNRAKGSRMVVLGDYSTTNTRAPASHQDGKPERSRRTAHPEDAFIAHRDRASDERSRRPPVLREKVNTNKAAPGRATRAASASAFRKVATEGARFQIP